MNSHAFDIVEAGSRWRTALVIVASALVLRLITFGNPILYTDEEFYFAAGRAMANGALPFVDIWDRKPIGLFLIFAGPARLPLPWGIWAYQFLALVCVIVTAMVVARLARRAGWHRGATLAAVAYVAWTTLSGGHGGQAPVFYNLFVALAALLIAEASPRNLAARGIAAMALMGLALQIKYTVAIEGAFFGLWILHLVWRQTRKVAAVIVWAAGLMIVALLPTLAAALFYAARHEFPAFLFANLLSIFDVDVQGIGKIGTLALSLAILLPLLVPPAFFSGRGDSAIESEDPQARRFVIGWLLAAIFAFVLMRSWGSHYTLPVILPGTVFAARFFSIPARRTASIGLVALAAIAAQVVVGLNIAKHGTTRQFAALTEAIGHGPGCLYVYSGSSMLYPATQRCAASRYVFPSHLTRSREMGAIGADQAATVRLIFQRAPDVVVMGHAFKGERPEIRALAMSLLDKDYRLVRTLKLGKQPMAIYARRQPLPPRPAVRFD